MEGASKFEQLRKIEISCNFTPENLLAIYPLLQDGFRYLTKRIKEFLAL